MKILCIQFYISIKVYYNPTLPKKKKIEFDNYSLNTQMLKIHAYSMYLEFHYTDYNHLYEINRRKKH